NRCVPLEIRIGNNASEDRCLKKEALLGATTDGNGRLKQSREHCGPSRSSAIVRPTPIVSRKTARVIQFVIQRLGEAVEAAPTEQLREPAVNLQGCPEFIRSYKACLPDCSAAYQASDRRPLRTGKPFDELKQPVRHFTFN